METFKSGSNYIKKLVMIDAAFRSMAAERSTPSPCYAEEPDLLTSEPLIPDMNDPSDILTDDHRRLVSISYTCRCWCGSRP